MTALERVIQNEEKVAKKQALIKKYENQIAKMESDVISKGWNPNDAHCNYGKSDFNESYWAICELNDKKRALETAQLALKDLEEVLNGWKEKAKKEEEKHLITTQMPEVFNSLKKQISDIWYEWDITERNAVEKAYAEYKKQRNALPEFENYAQKRDAEYKLYRDLIDDCFSKRSQNLYFQRVSDEQIRKNADKDAESSIMELYYRVLDITGKVTDWSNISLHQGTINGFVEGEEGKARVETIGAGGHSERFIVNVRHGQRFHFRTLVHKM